MRRSTLIAVLMALAVAGWLASPLLGLGADNPGEEVPRAQIAETAAERLTAVRTRTSTAEPVARELVLNGRTEADRMVHLAAETSGQVVEILKEKGDQVEAGEVIIRLDRRDREAAVAEAKATLAQREIENDAAERLGERGFQAETRVAESRAMLELARYHLKRAEVALSHTLITAPFAGVLEERPVELGSFVDIGDLVASIVDLDPVVVVTDVPEASIGRLSPGDAASIRTLNGRSEEGRISFVARQANEQTRTFRVEIEVPNPGAEIPAGISTEVVAITETVQAHPVSPGILVLADDGSLGIKSVDETSTVRFHPAQIVRAEADAIWLGGLPEELQLITVGQGFVTAGQLVEATAEAKVAAMLEATAGDDGEVR